jgi:outer membrane protein, multidrug efflux system
VRHPLIAGLALALAGCTSLAPPYVAPPMPVPQSWPLGDPALAASEAALPVVSYREVFRDPRLHALIDQALANNRDLQVAAANIAAARARVRSVRAGQFPAVGASAGADVVARGDGGTSQSYALQAGVTAFEIDLFGRLANATAAERATAISTEADARTVRLALISDLAEAWAGYAADAELLKIARDTAANAQRSVELSRIRLEGGIAPRTDLRQAEQILATAQGDLAQQTAALEQDVNLIQLLVGAPFDPALLPESLSEVLASIAPLPAGTSSEVLLRRPDVIEAEYLLRAATLDIGVARAALFPRISLTGLLGLASDALGALLTGGAFSARAGADASYSIFDAGGRRANIQVTEAQRNAALARYERTIQVAFREVSDQLAVQRTMADRAAAASLNTAAAADSARLTEARYRGGIEDFLGNLVAQRSLYAARRGEIAVRLAQIANRIAVFRTLGGDATTRVDDGTVLTSG